MAAQGFKIAQMFAEVSVEGIPKVTSQMSAVRSLFSSTSSTLTRGLAAALSRTETGFGGLQRIAGGMSQSLFGIVNGGRGASRALDGMSGLLAKTGTGAGNLATFLSGLRMSMNGSAQVASGFSSTFGGMLTVLRSGGGVLAAVSRSAFGVGRSLMAAASLPIGAGFQRSFSAARSAVRSFASGASSALSGFRSAVGSTLGAVKSAASGIGSSFLSIIPKLFSLKGALVAVGLAVGAVAAPVTMASEMESQQVAFKTMLGDAEKARAVMSDVTKFAAETPYELPELTGATKKMLAFGSSDKTVVNELRMIGDVASGVTAPIGEIAEIYGKARVQGRLFAEDVNQFTGRGIPIIQELAKQFGVSDGQVKKLVEDGKVGFPALEQAFQSMTGEGGKFHDMMKEQSKTGAGLWSTLMDNIKGGFRGLGEAMLPGVKKVMTALIELTGDVSGGFGGVKDAIASVSDWLGDKLSAAIGSVKAGMPYIQAYGDTVASAWKAATEMIDAAGSALWELLAPVRQLVPSVGSIGDAFMRLMEVEKFFFENWRLFLDIGVEETKLFGENAWESIKTFFDNGFAWVDWFAENWKDIFLSIGDYTATVFSNMGKNLGEFFYFLSQGRLSEFVWTGLEEGFKTSVKKVPKLVEAAIRESSPELDRAYDELGRRWGERSGRAASGEMTATSGMSETEKRLRAEKEAGKAAESTGAGKFERFGLEEFARTLQSRVKPGDKLQERMAANSDKQVAALGAIQEDMHKVAEQKTVPVYG